MLTNPEHTPDTPTVDEADELLADIIELTRTTTGRRRTRAEVQAHRPKDPQ